MKDQESLHKFADKLEPYCLHTQSMDIDKDSYKNLDLVLLYMSAWAFNPLYTGNSLMGTLANMEDPD